MMSFYSRLIYKPASNASFHSLSRRLLHSPTFRQECKAAARIIHGSSVSSSTTNSFNFLMQQHNSRSQYSAQRSLHSSAYNLFSDKNQQSGQSGNENNEGPNIPEDNKNKYRAALWIGAAYLFIVGLAYIFPTAEEQEQPIRYVSWNEFVHHMLGPGEVERVTVRPGLNIVSIHLHDGAVVKGKKAEQPVYYMNIIDIEHFEEKLRESEASLGLTGSQCVPVDYNRVPDTASKLITALLVSAVGFIFYRMSKANINIKPDFFKQLTRAKFTSIDPNLPGSGRGIKFSDVAGAKEAKQEVMEIVDFLKNPDKYVALGAKFPKGALLLGPPGCGKTLLAKAVATEGKVPFLAMNGPEFTEMIGGLGAARVRDLFVEAKKRAPCIIYIDEIDAVGRQRSQGGGQMDGSSEMEQTLNQLLVEMDGIGSKVGVFVLGSTNRFDMLDKALLRPGRFDRHIVLDLPTQEERTEILAHHMKGIPLERDIDECAKRMSTLTLGFSGAELANVVNEAALYAARNVRKKVLVKDLEYAVERMIGGAEKKSATVSPEEKQVVAYHEAGHALVGWMLEHTDALLKVTIVPRTSHALGFAQYQPLERKLYTKNQLFERMCMALGGRVAESLIFNRVTTGATDDLQKVTKMAYAQVRNFGFNEKVGLLSFKEPDEDARFTGYRPYSEKLTDTIDQEVNQLIFEAYKSTEQIINENMDKLRMLAETLLKQETVDYVKVEELWGPPPHGPKLNIDPLQFEGEIKGWEDAGKLSPEP